MITYCLTLVFSLILLVLNFICDKSCAGMAGNMTVKKIFVCEDSIDGIFTAIYDAWSSRYGHANIQIELQAEDGSKNLELFSEYIQVKNDSEKAAKVESSIKNKISHEAYEYVFTASCSNDKEKGDYIYRFLILGFSIGESVINYLGNDIVSKIFDMNRNVNNEVHHYLGFVRFHEIENNILYSKIYPKNDVLRHIAPHFADRLNPENFIIYDEKRKTAIFHRSGLPWVYTYADNLNFNKLDQVSEQESEFQKLWKTFFESIAIKERKNYKLQRNNLPIRFRNDMLEFDN